MPTALKSCPKSNKLPNQVTLLPTYLLTHIIHFSPSTQENTMFLFDKVTESKTVKLETSQTVIGTSPYIPTLYLSLVHHDNYSTISLQLSHLHSLSLFAIRLNHTLLPVIRQMVCFLSISFNSTFRRQTFPAIVFSQISQIFTTSIPTAFVSTEYFFCIVQMIRPWQIARFISIIKIILALRWNEP